jgi:hypothetical protein
MVDTELHSERGEIFLSQKNDQGLLDAIQKRDLLFGVKEMAKSQWRTQGLNLEKASWLSDAVDFLSKAEDVESLRRIREHAANEGDSFLVLKCDKALKEDSVEILLRCAKQAEKLGKIRYAIKALEKAGSTQEIQRLKQLIATDADQIVEEQVFIPEAKVEET